MYEQKFCKRLTELRIQKGVSARDMSLSIGQNSGYINHIENRQALPSLPVFFNICEYFDISPEQFFSTMPESVPCFSPVMEDYSISLINQYLKHLDSEQLHALMVLLKGLTKK